MSVIARLRDFTADRDATPQIAISAQGIDDELDQLDTGVEHDGKNAPGYELMKAVVQLGCRTAIKISEKI